jgi:ATP-dependent DNA ligase
VYAAPTDKLPSGSKWLHEIKHDGFRGLPEQGLPRGYGRRLLSRSHRKAAVANRKRLSLTSCGIWR